MRSNEVGQGALHDYEPCMPQCIRCGWSYEAHIKRSPVGNACMDYKPGNVPTRRRIEDAGNEGEKSSGEKSSWQKHLDACGRCRRARGNLEFCGKGIKLWTAGEIIPGAMEPTVDQPAQRCDHGAMTTNDLPTQPEAELRRDDEPLPRHDFRPHSLSPHLCAFIYPHDDGESIEICRRRASDAIHRSDDIVDDKQVPFVQAERQGCPDMVCIRCRLHRLGDTLANPESFVCRYCLSLDGVEVAPERSESPAPHEWVPIESGRASAMCAVLGCLLHRDAHPPRSVHTEAPEGIDVSRAEFQERLFTVMKEAGAREINLSPEGASERRIKRMAEVIVSSNLSTNERELVEYLTTNINPHPRCLCTRRSGRRSR